MDAVDERFVEIEAYCREAIQDMDKQGMRTEEQRLFLTAKQLINLGRYVEKYPHLRKIFDDGADKPGGYPTVRGVRIIARDEDGM